MITKDELADMIAALESQPHLSIKEEKYLKVCTQLSQILDTPEVTDRDCYFESLYYRGAEEN